jgi:hypothetical protein
MITVPSSISKSSSQSQVQISLKCFELGFFVIVSCSPLDSMLFYLLSSFGRDCLEDWRERRLTDDGDLFRGSKGLIQVCIKYNR